MRVSHGLRSAAPDAKRRVMSIWRQRALTDHVRPRPRRSTALPQMRQGGPATSGDSATAGGAAGAILGPNPDQCAGVDGLSSPRFYGAASVTAR